jgi:replication factor A1
MPVEQLISQIVSKCPGTSREQILKALEEEKLRTAGLIADSTLLRMVAHKLGIDILPEKVPLRTLSTRVLVPKLNDVTISGRIIATYPAKTFEGNKPGKFASLIIADKDGSLRVMLWNDKADLIGSEVLKTGQIARFSHAYTREDRNCKTELHLRERSNIEVNPQDLEEKNYPSLEEITTRVSQITDAHQNVHLSGRVKNTFGLSMFTRQDQTMGKVLRFTLTDEVSDIAVVAWSEKAEELAQTISQNTIVRLVNAKVRPNSGNGFEVHVDAGTYTEVSPR